MTGRVLSRSAKLRCTWLALCLVLAGRGAAADSESWEPKGISETQGILANAASTATWVELGERVVLLRGNAVVEQGSARVQAQQIYMRIDIDGFQKTQRYNIRLVADGNVEVGDGVERRSVDSVIGQLGTSGEIRLESAADKLNKQALADDPFARRALQQLSGGVASAAPFRNTAQSKPTPAEPTQLPAPRLAPIPNPGDPNTAAPSQPPIALGPTIQPGPLVGESSTRVLNIMPRTSAPFQIGAMQMPNGEQVILVTGGVLLTIKNVQGIGLIDIEAEQLVFWTRGDSNNALEKLRSSDGLPSQEQEFYLAGDVQIRNKSGTLERKLRAEQVYYDVKRNVAVAVTADLEMNDPRLPEALHLKAVELLQVSPRKFEANQAQIFASRLPSDPGLYIRVEHATVEDKEFERRTLFGLPVYNTKNGQPQVKVERQVRGENVFLHLEGVPILYLPYIQGDANEPLGPLQNIAFRQDRIFGTQILITWNMWSLLNLDPLPNTRWTLATDYFSERGPALGTDYQYAGNDLFGLQGPFSGTVKLYGIHDDGQDILGGGRGENDDHPLWRGRVLARHQQQIFDFWTFQSQIALISDKNFIEQYWKQEWDTGLNQELYAYLKWQRGNFAATGLLMPTVRDWLTTDVWLPQVTGQGLGLSFFDLFTYNVRAQAGYAQLRPTTVPPPPVINPNTDVRNDTGRFDVFQDLSLPLYLGPVKFVPYGVLDLTSYTNDLNGDSTGRVYGGGGARASLPFTRIYPDTQSELFNLCGINHKVVWGLNYFAAQSNEPYSIFAQIDRMNDDATDQALRDITPLQPSLNPANGVALQTSPIFNPQLYAIRKLVDNRVDTLDSMQVLQADVRQRWQTKRGYPGMQHVVDFFTLDLSASLFPDADRDNFGKSFAFLAYDAVWNIGDRTALTSSGLYDPFDEGTRVFTVGAFLNRPDRTNFYLGFRAIDPINSRAMTGAVTYIFSPKYALTASSTYDFGTDQALSNSFVVTRMGSDLTVSVGFTYNQTVNTFGFTFEIVPNIVGLGRSRVTPSAFNTPLFR